MLEIITSTRSALLHTHPHAQHSSTHIHTLSTPPHTTHKLQPLDRVFFKPFKRTYGSASTSWMRQNPGARLTEYDVAGQANTAFTKVARLEIVQNGFRCTGIQPFDREIFSDLDFLSSALTDIRLTENQADQSTTQFCCHAAATENEPEPSTSASTLASCTLQRQRLQGLQSIPKKLVTCLKFCRLSQTPQRIDCLSEREGPRKVIF